MEKEYKKYCFKKFRKLRILRHTGECETYTQIRMESRQVRRKEKNHFFKLSWVQCRESGKIWLGDYLLRYHQ